MPSATDERRSARTPKTEFVSLQSGGLEFYQARALRKFPWLVHGFSSRSGGTSVLDGQRVLNLGFTNWDPRGSVERNRKHFLAALNAEGMPLVTLRQFHSDVVVVMQSPPDRAPRADAAATRTPGLLLSVQTADCVPILLADAKHRAVAAVHAGWRGTLKRIVQKALGRMRMEFGTAPEDVLAALGPAIGGCCYEVGAEVARTYAGQFASAADWFEPFETGEDPNPLQWLSMTPPGHNPPPRKSKLDLIAANRWQLLDAGVKASNITASGLCTACRTDLFFSYRREGTHTGRLMAVIGIRG